MAGVGEFSVDFNLKGYDEVMKSLDRFEDGMEDAEKSVEDFSKTQLETNKSVSTSWLSFGKIATAAVTTLYANMMKYSPAIQAHMTSIGVAMQLVGMEMGDALDPIFQVIEDIVWGFSDWFGGLDEGIQTVLSLAVAAAILVAGLVALGAGPEILAAIGAVALLGVAYETNFGNMQDNVDSFIKNFGEGDWEGAADDVITGVEDLAKEVWTTIADYDWNTAWDSLLDWFDDMTDAGGALGRVVGTLIAHLGNWISDEINKPEFGDKVSDAISKAFDVGINVGKIIATSILNAIIAGIEEIDWLPLIKALAKSIWMSSFGAPKVLGDAMIKSIKNAWDSVKGNPWDSLSGSGDIYNPLPYQAGGYIPHTGLYNMHAGEHVTSAGGSSGNGGGSGDMYVTNNNIFYGNTLGDRHQSTQAVNQITDTMKNSLKTWQSTAVGGRF